jgi:hypothetical protein
LSWIDDLTIGTRLETDAQAAVHALTELFKAHPAGPLELHKVSPLAAASWKVEVLGYFLEPNNGYGGTIHVKPGPKRCRKFRANLTARLHAAGPHGDLYKIAEEYRKQWFQAQQAWTKVPVHSMRLTQSITASYVDDFKCSIPMGENHPTMVKLAKCASATGPAPKTQPAP